MLTRHRAFRVLVLCAALMSLAVPAVHASHSLGVHLAQLNGRSQPTVFMVDYSDSSWPVSAAVGEWSADPYTAIYRYSYCPNSNDYCVPVNQTSFNSAVAYARTFYQDNGNGHFSRSNFYINLYVTPNSLKRSVICHELGHVLGLDERPSSATNSCMTQSTSVFPNYPDGHDYNQLLSIYEHAN